MRPDAVSPLGVVRIPRLPTPEEVRLTRELVGLQHRYEAEAKPILDRLAEIERLHTPRYMVTGENPSTKTDPSI